MGQNHRLIKYMCIKSFSYRNEFLNCANYKNEYNKCNRQNEYENNTSVTTGM